MRVGILACVVVGLFASTLTVVLHHDGNGRLAEQRSLMILNLRESLRTARYERDAARDSLREARWAMDQIAKADGWRDSIPPGKWPRYRFAVRAFPDSNDR